VQKRLTQSQGQKRIMNTLPGYFFNMSGRNGAVTQHSKTLQDQMYPEAGFSNPKSTLNDKKRFRVNPETR
jgi:ABC-type Fe3+-hydroxamate transport system substrate-binding protein